MPEWIAENCVVPFMLGILTTGAFGAFAFMMQNRTMAMVAGLIGLLSIGLVVAERYIITEKEELELLLFKTANAVEFNRHDEVLSYMKSPAKEKAAKEMPSYEFRICNVAGINSLEIDDTANPKTASITFVVYADVRAPSYGHDGYVRREVTLYLQKQPTEEWLITGYSHRQPNAGARL